MNYYLLAIALIPFSIGLTGCVGLNVTLLMMIGEINRRKSEDEQVAYLGYGPTKMVRVFSEYRELYPEGRLATYAKASIGVMIAGTLVAFVLVVYAKP